MSRLNPKVLMLLFGFVMIGALAIFSNASV